MPPIVVTAPLTGILYARPEILVMTSFSREAAVAETGGLRHGAVFLLENPNRPVLEPIEYLGFHVFRPPAVPSSPVSPGEPELWKLPESERHLKDWFLALGSLGVSESIGDRPAISCLEGRVFNVGALSVAMMTAAGFERSVGNHGYVSFNRRRHADVLIVSGLMDDAVLDKAFSSRMTPLASILVYQSPSGPSLRSGPKEIGQPDFVIGLGPTDDGYARIRLENSDPRSAQESARVSIRRLAPRFLRTPALKDLLEQVQPFSKRAGIAQTLNDRCSSPLYEELTALFERSGVWKSGYILEEAVVEAFLAATDAAAGYLTHLETKAGGDARSNVLALEEAWSVIETAAMEHRRETVYAFARFLDLWFGRELQKPHPYR